MLSKAKSRLQSGAKEKTEKKAAEKQVPVNEKEIGRVMHYYTKLGVAAIDLKDGLKVGDEIHILGHTTDFNQKVDSMQIEHKVVTSAKKGDSMAIKVKEHVRENDVVYKVEK